MFERGDRVLVDGFDGIVCWVVGHPPVYDPHGGDTGMGDPDILVVVMVGDDQRHHVYTEDVQPLPEDEHVCSCGQRGCPHN